ncbi:hypothetical protein ART_2171 [Arthrobacter sp. PAMC 25486]|nr:hypothetical protein ART_2171 [Arthrobacter sp. PAMC 25486]
MQVSVSAGSKNSYFTAGNRLVVGRVRGIVTEQLLGGFPCGTSI